MIGYLKELATIYTTPRLVQVRSPFLATLSTIIVILVWCSFLGSLRLDIAKTYQSSCPVHGVVLSKVKGFASTEHLTDEDLSVPNPELYRSTWDPADLVYPAQGGEGETGSFTVITNIIITSNQTLSTCAESMSQVSHCTKDSDCQKGFWSPRTHGVFTGKCRTSNQTCEIKGWCPIENVNLPRRESTPLLENVENFTVMLKNSVEFPDCGNQQGKNLPNHLPPGYLQNCTYDKIKDPLCPIFRIGDIVKWSGDNFSRVAVKGGVFRIQISWECDFDFGRTVENCKPKYKFIRVDDKEAGVSTGWNFRSADFYKEDQRTLKKQYGLKILISLDGEGRKFDFFQLVITLGATIGLFSVAPLVCDFLLDLLNKLSESRKCGKEFSSFHDNTVSRYEDGGAGTPSTSPTNGPVQHQGVTNLGMSSSTMSINNESYKQTEPPSYRETSNA